MLKYFSNRILLNNAIIWKGTPREEAKKLKAENKMHTAPYQWHPNQVSDIWMQQRKNFHELLQFERAGRDSNTLPDEGLLNFLSLGFLPSAFVLNETKEDKQEWKEDERYRAYIETVRKDMDRCWDCHLTACSWCRKCNVIHYRSGCGDTLYRKIKAKHGTWRRHFKDLSRHEGALMWSYYRPIADSLRGEHCPCHVIYDHTNKERYDEEKKEFYLFDDYEWMIKLLRGFDSRTLEKHLELTKPVNPTQVAGDETETIRNT